MTVVPVKSSSDASVSPALKIGDELKTATPVEFTEKPNTLLSLMSKMSTDCPEGALMVSGTMDPPPVKMYPVLPPNVACAVDVGMICEA